MAWGWLSKVYIYVNVDVGDSYQNFHEVGSKKNSEIWRCAHFKNELMGDLLLLFLL